MTSLPLPGAVGLSHLRAYDSEGPDGLRGGTPHLHTVCTEAYAVITGEGLVQTLTPEGFEETPLAPGTLAWFAPGTVHRLVNLDGRLELFVVMQNLGLPEAGDMVITFPAPVLADAEAYAGAAVLPPDERTTAGTGDAARQRRDLGVEGFLALRQAVEDDAKAAMTGLYERAAALVGPSLGRWHEVWEDGPSAVARSTGAQIAALGTGDVSHLLEARVAAKAGEWDERRMGCCGTLGVYLPPATAS